jgi:hypothetical protein
MHRMSASPETEPFMLAAWEAAVSDSELQPSEVHLLSVPGAAICGSNKAACYPLGIELVDEPHDRLHGSTLVEANMPEHI